MRQQANTVIVGAGIAGLHLAQRLVARGHRAILLEVAAREGGFLEGAVIAAQTLAKHLLG